MVDWVYQDYNEEEEHFYLLYKSFSDDESDAEITEVCVLGRDDANKFCVEMLEDPTITEDMRKACISALDYYLKELPEEWGDDNPKRLWDYLVYHATQTAANHYGRVTWRLVEPDEEDDDDFFEEYEEALRSGNPVLIQQSLSDLKDMAKAHDRAAIILLGQAHYKGWGVKKDPATSAAYYLHAAHLDVPEAQIIVAMFYDHGIGFEKNALEAAAWDFIAALNQCADAGDIFRAYGDTPEQIDEVRKRAEEIRRSSNFTEGEWPGFQILTET